jgi:hypothetical protein
MQTGGMPKSFPCVCVCVCVCLCACRSVSVCVCVCVHQVIISIFIDASEGGIIPSNAALCAREVQVLSPFDPGSPGICFQLPYHRLSLALIPLPRFLLLLTPTFPQEAGALPSGRFRPAARILRSSVLPCASPRLLVLVLYSSEPQQSERRRDARARERER